MTQSRRIERLWMRVIAAVLRSGFVREDFVVSHVIEIDAITSRTTNDRWVDPQIADQRRHCNVHYIVPETPAIRPTARHNAPTEPRLNRARQGITIKDAQA